MMAQVRVDQVDLSELAALERGLKRMADFLRAEGIYDERRLPTNAVLAPIAATIRRGRSRVG